MSTHSLLISFEKKMQDSLNSLIKDLSTINKEILYISGEKDMGAPAMAMEEMHHLTPNSKYECISGAAHILNIECAEKVNNIILDFLN